jgi:hypothetical protein
VCCVVLGTMAWLLLLQVSSCCLQLQHWSSQGVCVTVCGTKCVRVYLRGLHLGLLHCGWVVSCILLL